MLFVCILYIYVYMYTLMLNSKEAWVDVESKTTCTPEGKTSG